MLSFNSINDAENQTEPKEVNSDEASREPMDYSWQPVSSSHRKSRTKKLSTVTMMITAAIVAGGILAAILVFGRNNNSGESDGTLPAAVSTTAQPTTKQPSTQNPTKASDSTQPSTDGGATSATKPKKSLLDFIDSLDINVDGISPDQPHIKDNTLFLEYYFFGEYTPEDEEEQLPTPESEESSLFSGYMQRLAVISQYIESQVEKNGYSISKIVVEGYDSTGKQFYHIQSSPKSRN